MALIQDILAGNFIDHLDQLPKDPFPIECQKYRNEGRHKEREKGMKNEGRDGEHHALLMPNV